MTQKAKAAAEVARAAAEVAKAKAAAPVPSLLPSPSGIPPPPDRTLLGGPWDLGTESAKAAWYQQHGRARLQNLEDQADHWLAYHLENKPSRGPFEP